MRLLFVIFVFFGLSSHASDTSVVSFKQWKEEKVKLAEQELAEQRALSGLQNMKELQQLNKRRWTLEVAQDLSVSDYIILYLAQNPSPNKYKDAAQKLEVEQIAELLEAYTKATENRKTLDISIQATQH